MRLIDAYALQAEIQKSKILNPHKDAKTATNHELEHDHFMQMVALQPTAQEEIVRCKDCRHQNWVNVETGCIVCKFGRGTNAPDWFCADGERREDDG